MTPAEVWTLCNFHGQLYCRQGCFDRAMEDDVCTNEFWSMWYLMYAVRVNVKCMCKIWHIM